MHFAVKRSTLEIVEHLMEQGIDLTITDSHGKTPMNIAIDQNRTEMIEYLIEKGAATIECTLHKAAEIGRFWVVVNLIEQGAVMTIDSDGCTPLHKAAKGDHFDVVEYLVERGTDLTIANSDGKTPLDIAREYDDKMMVRYLKKKEADFIEAQADCGSVWNKWDSDDIDRLFKE